MMDDSKAALAGAPTDDAHLAKPERPVKSEEVYKMTPDAEVVLESAIEIRDRALSKFNRLLRVAATLSGVPEDVPVQGVTNGVWNLGEPQPDQPRPMPVPEPEEA